MADNKGVMIFIEATAGKLDPIAKELLGAGRKLANNLKEELSALVVGSGVDILQPRPSPLAPIRFILSMTSC